MSEIRDFDVIIAGGSYAGLSAAMTLGRSLRRVLIIDSGQPCNAQTPHSHNFLTRDGDTPSALRAEAMEQVLAYPSVQFQNGMVSGAAPFANGFCVTTIDGETISARKLLFATGLKDVMLPLEGFATCWGISVLHCPYCHGYEVSHRSLGILANGDTSFEMARMIYHWSKNLTLYTDGPSTLTAGQREKIAGHSIQVVEKKIQRLSHTNGQLQQIDFADGTSAPVHAIFARPEMQQHCTVPMALGCELTEEGFLKTDEFGHTTIPGVFAAGDCRSRMRTVSVAVASGTMAAAFINKELINENF